ncbi:MAG: hypothetical protein NMK33_05835 [Candidatus Cardinium sp.]|uniref:hypothetical protein n=1 Tax=Cardinium endosymbiont of Dermatophagoides farinae TaxID=2597823 RepID=UPI001183771D|nr:hypothetical protein [Cardinium endosymbiont of Dermatophagoides farinae]TSJ80922.1 hypothetical protein FPG78_02635 [Cardinium endosymbiont of Dermatophagoides farinae]UWW96938.1 MAG: hypothetical protein NMK33_05835 [Candidatus Cardinium sp.]
MSSLEDNQKDQRIIERFENMLMQLLQAHSDYQKQIMQLTEENKKLKSLLEGSKISPSRSTAANHKAAPLAHHLVDQLNKYIKEIDLCLTYFEQA